MTERMTDRPTNTNTRGGAARYSSGKPPWQLLPWDALAVLVQVYQMGSVKYAPRNWEQGLSVDETFGALMRHLTAWHRGEDRDTESGQLHLAHVAWNAITLLAFAVRGRTELDDRPAYGQAEVIEQEDQP